MYVEVMILTSLIFLCFQINIGSSESLTCRPWSIDGLRKPIHHRDKCYVPAEIEKTWYEAKYFCEEAGGDLAQIKSAPIHDAVMRGLGNSCYFIGLMEGGGEWRWIDGSLVNYTRWEATGGWLFKTKDKCAAICSHAILCRSFQWQRKKCSSRLKFVCEYDPVPADPVTEDVPKDTFRCLPWSTGESVHSFLFKDKCYIRTNFKKPWDQARDFCVKYGGDLVKIESQEEHDAITGDHLNLCLHIGLHKRSGEWEWVDGSPVTFDMFAPEPEDYVLMLWQECGAMCVTDSCGLIYRWTHRWCEDEWKFICEYDPVVVKAPKVSQRRRQRRKEHSIAHRREPNAPRHRLLSTPDLSISVRFNTECSRICKEKVQPCAIYNYHAKSRTCNCYSSRTVLEGRTEESLDWEVWEAVIV